THSPKKNPGCRDAHTRKSNGRSARPRPVRRARSSTTSNMIVSKTEKADGRRSHQPYDKRIAAARQGKSAEGWRPARRKPRKATKTSAYVAARSTTSARFPPRRQAP